MAVPLICKVCQANVALAGETRFMWVDSDESIRISQRLGKRNLSLDLEVCFRLSNHHVAVGAEAFVCGQRDALILAERYMDRATFEPAPPPPLCKPTEYAQLIGGTK